MKRYVLSAAALVFSAACSSPAGPAIAPPLQTARTASSACASLTLTGHPDYPPVAWANGKTLDGGGIDVVRRLARAAGVALRVVNEGTWAKAQLAVNQGRADAIVGIYYTPQRATFLDYLHPALAPDPSAVVIRPGETFAYVNWKSLIGKQGVAGAGESYGPKFDAFLAAKLHVSRVPTTDDVFHAVVDSKAGYGLSGYYSAVTSSYKGKIAFATTDFVTEGLYLAFGKQSPCLPVLAAPFARNIKTMVDNGTVKTIFAKALKRYERLNPPTIAPIIAKPTTT